MSVLTFRRTRREPVDPIAEQERAAELARLAADQAHANAERDRVALASRIELARLERDAARQDSTQDQSERRANRSARQARRAAARLAWAARLRPVMPLLVVNGTAMYGQIAVGYEQLTPSGTNPAARLGVALLVATAAELVAVYVGWHAHDALLRGDGRTAGQLRRASYLIAGLIAAVNYSHFAGAGFAPTAAAVVFGLMSASSPWLWGLHTRRAQHVQLAAQGRADTAGAVFSGERLRAFPIRTWQARRWSIDHGVNDPAIAWEGYNASRADGTCRCQETGLPAVPTAAERAALDPAEVRERARRTYLTAVATGVPIGDQLLATAYGMRARWARERIREARADHTEDR